jgi:beta-ureidopropionase / N-carbamoyl-L-amino-acid hydrolase
MTATTLAAFNAAAATEAAQVLDGIYEHSPWIAQAALAKRPFASVAALEQALMGAVATAGPDAQLALIRAHPELAGKAMVAQHLTEHSTDEQSRAGLTHCSADEFARLQQLNADYNRKFGWPFILAVRGARGTGLSRTQIIDTFARRLAYTKDQEFAECLRQIHRIAQIRLHERMGTPPTLGEELWDWHQDLAQHSDPGFAEQGQLTVTYQTEAHRAAAADLAQRMRDCGFDSVEIDVLGNVVGRYHNNSYKCPMDAGNVPKNHVENERFLLTGSHYDTVRNAGRYDGRLGILLPMMAVRELHRANTRLPFGIELVAFAEEEGQRFKATFLAASALVGDFKAEWLEQTDADGISMEKTIVAGVQSRNDAPISGANDLQQRIAAIRRDPAQYLGFVEVHIEQGPVLNELNLPLGVVTSINGSVRYLCEITGLASHAGTTPMDRRRDAALAAAEIALYVEKRALQDADSPTGGSVGTMGMLHVPNGSINVVPGRCQFSLDLRAPTDAQRGALSGDVLQRTSDICAHRGVQLKVEESMRVAAAPSDPAWQARWAKAVAATGAPVHLMPSGAGHDAMKLHQILPQAMLFVRGENAGISHNPLESTTAADMHLALEAFNHLLAGLANEPH